MLHNNSNDETDGQRELSSLVAVMDSQKVSQLQTRTPLRESGHEIFIDDRYAVQTDHTNIPYENETERYTC